MHEVHCDKQKQKLQSIYSMEFYISLVFHHLSYNSELQNEVEVVMMKDIRNREPFIRYRNYKGVGLTLPNFTIQALLEN